jgi:uncharacterized protein
LTSSESSQRPPRRSRATLGIAIGVIVALVIVFFIFAGLYTDWLWFDQLGFLGVLTTQWLAGGTMFLVGFFGMAVPVWVCLQLAFRSRPMYAKLNAQLDRYQQVIEPLRQVAMIGIPILLGIFAGVATSSRWPIALEFLNQTQTGIKDPQFHLDVAFYLFNLPFFQSALAFASAVILLSALATLATSYLYGSLRLNGRELRISKAARIQLAVIGAVYLAVQALSIWLDQYATMATSSTTDLLVGASNADVSALIPGRQILAGAAAIVAVLFIITAFNGRWRFPIIGTALLLVMGLLIGSVYPWFVQKFQVDPSAKTAEAPYIQRNIDATRAAYGVADVKEAPYTAATDTEPGALRNDAETTANIRIIDPALVTEAYAQLQQIKQYYQFEPRLDVDRYTINGETQDTVIGVRELDISKLGSATSWYNNTVVYTHGYGVVAAYGNQRSSDGLPVFLESGIPSTGALGKFEPRIYFGENSPTYSIVGAPKGAKQIELDYPSGDQTSNQNATTTYQGDGGPKLDNIFKKLIFAIKFQSEQVFLSDAVTNDSQILYERDPKDRVQKVAPYLTLDSDAYPAVVDGRVVWIVDGYTTSDTYPYSDIRQLSRSIADTYTPAPAFAVDNINYIRNSVKATVDAYSGKVTLYAWDAKDPILKTWQKIFPNTLEPMSKMSSQLLSHVRYPADLFKVQRAILGTYHVTKADSFYSNDDAWITPNEPVTTAGVKTLQPPYYLTMKMPGADKPAFSLYSTYIPQNARDILAGYLAVDADAGNTPGQISPDYGKFTLLALPKQNTVPGPGQVQNNFNSDPTVSTELNLLSQGSTDVVKGNLLTLPVGGGLLYVQPVYIKSTGETSYPILQKVLVAFGDKIAFEPTLNAALDQLFGGNSGATAGDTGVETPTTPPGTETPPTTPTTPAQPSSNTALQSALQDASKALKDREAAYAANDLVAAAQADERLQKAIEAALAADK